MNQRIVIGWRNAPVAPAEAEYLVNGASMGQGDAGFDRVLEFVRQHQGVPVVIQLGALPLNSADLEAALPFGHRLSELERLVAPHTIAYEM